MEFKKVPTVQAKEAIRSESHNTLAQAFNQRILAGAGDAAWRIVWNAHSLMRQVRNPSGDSLAPGTQQWPASDEWWKIYSLVDNTTRCAGQDEPWYWPTALPGKEEGANVANPIMAFVFGRDIAGTKDAEPEVNRLTNGPSDEETEQFEPVDVVTLSGDADQDAATCWEQAKLQRGIMEKTAPFRAEAPAYEAAHSAYSWRYAGVAPYLKTYSTFAPVPRSEGFCPKFGDLFPIRWTARFQPLLPGLPTLEYPTCPGVAGHLQFIQRGTDAYVLYFQTGGVVVLPYSMYLEGPYAGGGALARPHSELLTQAINKFVAEMRGSQLNRSDTECYQVEANAFDFQSFFSRQYALAPAAVGVYNSGTGQIDSLGYPTFTLAFSAAGFQQTVSPGTLFSLSVSHPGDSADTHLVAPPFVFTAALITSTNVVGPADIEFLDQYGNAIHLGAPVDTCASSPQYALYATVDASSGTTKHKLIFLQVPASPGSLRVRLKNQVVLSQGGSISVEILEQASYLPDVQDAYVVLRCGLTQGDDLKVDPTGYTIDGTVMRQLSDNYFKYGCITNVNGVTNIAQHPTAVNYNPIYESARQLIAENVRMVPRTQLSRYEVNSGKSTIEFRRHAVGNGENGDVQIIEEEVRPVVVSQVVEPTVPADLVPRLEYVVRKLGKDNIRAQGRPNSSEANKVYMRPKYPVDVYSDGDEVYCDDFVLYGNVKYVPPGYNTTSAANLDVEAFPTDAANNYDHVIVGMPVPTYAPEEQVPVGYIKLTENTDVKTHILPTFERTRVYTDSLGNLRTELIKAARVHWQSSTTTGVAASLDIDGKPAAYTKEWRNQVLHTSPERTGEETPEETSKFRFHNGFRYAVQRRLKVASVWQDWVTVADGASDDPNATGKYGFDAGDATPLGAGVYYFEDPAGYNKTPGVDVEYRVVAKPVLDKNHSRMEVYQRAYFTPLQISWTGQPGAKYRIKRRQQRYGQAVEEVDVSGLIDGQTSNVFIDLPSTLCPVAISAGALELKNTYEAYDAILDYRRYIVSGETETLEATLTPAQLAPTSPALVVRPDNIVPTEPADLVGAGDSNLLDSSGNPLLQDEITVRDAFCSALTGLGYKVYGPSSVDGTSGIRFVAPWYHSTTGARTEQVVEIGAGNLFGWYSLPKGAAELNGDPFPNPCAGSTNCINPWLPSRLNFTNLTRVWAPTGGSFGETSLFQQQAKIFQYGVYAGGCSYATLKVIENTAGCEHGNHLGVFVYDTAVHTLSSFRKTVLMNESWAAGVDPVLLPRYNTPDDFSSQAFWFGDNVALYSSTLRSSQWTPWSSKAPATFSANDGLWYVLRTGYERIHVDTLRAPAPGNYEVRGQGFVTYKGQNYYSGQTVPFAGTAPEDLFYSASDYTTKLVTVSSVACSSELFDSFSGIAPRKDLGEFDLRIGREYRVHRGKGIRYQKKTEEGIIPTEVAPGATFVWQDGDSGLERISGGEEQSQVRDVEGIIPSTAVPRRGESNEWCMFLSFNHYHTSNSSMWKTDAYGDVMPFLHNRCHTYSSELRGPYHAALGLHFAYGQELPLVSEAAPGYTYLEDVNQPYGLGQNAAQDYFRSCQVYRVPYEVESAQVIYEALPGQTDPDGNQKYDDSKVRIVLKQRLQSTSVAPSSVDTPTDTVTATQIAKLRAEPYRTDENGIREYLTLQAAGKQCAPGKIGDSSTSYDVFSLPDSPFGACHPRCYFVKLVPHVYSDGNSSVENTHDTLIKIDPYIQMDLYLRAMCGGWMDLQSLRGANCDQGLSKSPVGDYLYENLCLQACRSDGAVLDVTPEVVTGKTFLPIQTVAQYEFTYAPELEGSTNDPLVLEYRTWQQDRCAFGDWTRLEGSVQPSNTETPIGGSNYRTPPTVEVSVATPDRIKFVPLNTPVTLTAGETYHLVTNETAGGDQWRNKDNGVSPALLNSTGITAVHPAVYSGAWSYSTNPVDADTGMGPVAFRTGCVGCTQSDNISVTATQGSLRNDVTGKVGLRFTVGAENLTVYELGRIVVAGNTGSHVVELLAADGSTVLGSVTVDTDSPWTTPGDPASRQDPKLRATVSGGGVTAIEIDSPGFGLDAGKLAQIDLKISSVTGSGATASVTALDGNGGVSAVTVNNSGSGYASPVVVTFTNEEFVNPSNKLAAQATATIGSLKLGGVAVGSAGSGYNFATVVFSGGGGTGAAAEATVSGGAITAITVTNPGEGYTTAPDVLIIGDGTGATATASMDLVASQIGSIVAINLTPATMLNYGYASTPTVQITGGDAGDNSATGAYAVAQMQVVDLQGDAGSRVSGVVMTPIPNGNVRRISMPFNGPTFAPSEFRFTRLSDWPNGHRNPNATLVAGVSVTPTVKLLFDFIPDNPGNPHKYTISRQDHTYGNGCKMSGTWLELTSPGGEAGPVCDNNKNRADYDDCREACACFWPDPNSSNVAPLSSDPPASGDIVGSTYRIQDMSEVGGSGQITSIGVLSQGSGYSANTVVYLLGGGGIDGEAQPVVVGGQVTSITLTNAGAGYTGAPEVVIHDPTGSGSGAAGVASVDTKNQSYYLNWPMQPLVAYNVERKLFYKYDTDSDWQTLATNARAPYVDNADWEESFDRVISTTRQDNYSVVGTPQVVAAVDASSATARTVSISASQTYKNVHVDCVVTVEVPLEGGGTTTVDYPVDTLLAWVTDPASGQISDARRFAEWDGRIVSFTYTLKELASVQLTWRNLPNHAALLADLVKSGLVYELHRKYETGGAEVDEVLAVSSETPTPPNFSYGSGEFNSTTWSGWADVNKRRLDDQRNNTEYFQDGDYVYNNSESFYVVARWRDWPETKCITNAQQNREACTAPDADVPCVLLNRQYRVIAATDMRSRWFTTMPVAININRPQGFGPQTNTCTYAEMFNNYARAINLLRYARLELPFAKMRRTIYRSSIPASYWESNPSSCMNMTCGTSGGRKNACATGTPYATYSAWEEIPVSEGVNASAHFGPTGTEVAPSVDCSNMLVGTYRTDVEVAAVPRQSALQALPAALRPNFSPTNIALIGTRIDETGNCRIRSGLDYSCAADFCCRPSTIEGNWCACRDQIGGTEYTKAGCNCGCRLSIDGSYARNECQVLQRTEGSCSVFMSGLITAPALPCGDISWIGSTDGTCMGGGAWAYSSVSGIRSLAYLSFPLY